MKRLLVSIVVVAAAITSSAASVRASTLTARAPESAIAGQQQQVDPHDDTRVEVQLVVLGAVIALVVVVGTGAYLLRRRLGLTTYSPPPEAPGGGH
jgi:uncharacterized membrane protein